MEEKRFSLGDHLDELRRRLVYAVVFFGLCLVACFLLQKEIMAIICKPHFAITQQTLKAFKYPEGFIVYFKAVMIAAAILATPFAIYQIWKFISAGLHEHEKRHVYFYAPVSLTLFVAGVLFGYFLFIPPTLKFLFFYGDLKLVETMPNLNDYFNLFIMLTLLLGLVFELPLLMLFLVQIKLLSPQKYLSHIRAVILAAFIASAIITPSGDPFTQTLLAVPLLLLYGLGVLLSFIYYKKPEPGSTDKL